MIPGNSDLPIRLLDGSYVFASEIDFNPGNYHFYYGGDDITMLVTVQDKRENWPAFDVTVWNEIYLKTIKPQLKPTGSTSYWGNLGSQLYNDPFAAPLEQGALVIRNTENAAGKAINSVVTGLISNPLLLVAVVGVAYYIYQSNSNRSSNRA